MKLTEYRRICFSTESAPTMNTLRARHERGDIPGACKVGRMRYIDMDVFDAATNFRQGLENKRRELAKHPALEGLLS